MDHEVHLDAHLQLQPQTIGILGAQVRQTDYTANQVIGADPTSGEVFKSQDRNARMYYGYVGADHNFQPDLTGSIRAGARYTDYVNNPTDQNGFSPYAMASLRVHLFAGELFPSGGQLRL